MDSIKLFVEANKGIFDDYIILKVIGGYKCYFVCNDDYLDKLDDNVYHDSGGDFWLQPQLISFAELQELKEVI